MSLVHNAQLEKIRCLLGNHLGVLKQHRTLCCSKSEEMQKLSARLLLHSLHQRTNSIWEAIIPYPCNVKKAIASPVIGSGALGSWDKVR